MVGNDRLNETEILVNRPFLAVTETEPGPDLTEVEITWTEPEPILSKLGITETGKMAKISGYPVKNLLKISYLIL